MNSPTFRKRTVIKRSLAVLAALVAVTALGVSLRSPSLTRTWDEDVRVLAGIDALDDGRVAMQNIRDWRYTLSDVVDQSYYDDVYDPDGIADLWMYEQNLDDKGHIAHTFLVFEFGQRDGPDRFLGISVETRREVGEKYSIVGGMLRKFEVTHIWATERDLVRRRVEFLDYPLTRFRLQVPADTRSRIFRKLVAETHALSTAPRWYHTALNNCTSSLIRYVNDSESDAIPLHYSYVLTGHTAEYLGQLGFLEADSATHIDRAFLRANPLR